MCLGVLAREASIGKAVSMPAVPHENDETDFPPMTPVELNCPSCDSELAGTELFERFRVCPECHRHFGMPARERIRLLVAPGGFQETSGALVSLDPVRFHDHLPVADRLSETQERSVISEAVITGTADVGGHPVVLVALDAGFTGGAIGVLAGEKLALAFDLALSRRLPLIALCAGGAVRTQDGMLAVLQTAKVATLAARMHRAGIPIISVITHPTTGGVLTGLANQADIILAEPGAVAGGDPAAGQGQVPSSASAEQLLGAGLIDDIVERPALMLRLATIVHLLCGRGTLSVPATPVTSPSTTSPTWEALRIGHHPDRPAAAAIARKLVAEFQPLHGDRIHRDDDGLSTGIGRFEGLTVAVIAHDRRFEGEKRLPLSASAYRKAARMMQLAGRFELPLLSFVDTPGAASGVEAELSGISMAVGQNLQLMGQLPAPVIAVITGQAGGTGALANALGDRILAAEFGLFTLPIVEGAQAHPFFRRVIDAQHQQMAMGAREAKELGVVDLVIPEPEGGAHLDPDGAAVSIKAAVAQSLGEVLGSGARKLGDDRLWRARMLGLAAAEGDDTVRRELRELVALQHSLSRSIDDFRHDLKGKWEQGRQAIPMLATRLPRRPDLNDLASRITALRETVSNAASANILDRFPERKSRSETDEPPTSKD
jgi:acetyl-CoA carboxylase carboxyl transferase subunit beta